jgi:hypothetical protein
MLLFNPSVQAKMGAGKGLGAQFAGFCQGSEGKNLSGMLQRPMPMGIEGMLVARGARRVFNSICL